MAIKFGRPIEARTHLAPVENEAHERLDLASRPRRNRQQRMGAPHGARERSSRPTT